MSKRRHSIRRKLVLLMTAATLSALLVVSSFLVYYDLRSYGDMVTRDIESQTELLASASTAALSFDDPIAAGENLRVLRFRDRVSEAAIYNARGAIFATYTRGGEAMRFPTLPEAEGVTVAGDHLVSFARIVENNEILGTAYIRAEYGLYDRLRTYLLIVTLVTLAALAFALLVSLRLQRLITGPLLSVAAVARQVVTRHDYALRAHKTTDDEVGDLTDAFNTMLAEIESRRAEILRLNAELESRIRQRTAELERSNRELESFSYSVSHDLRSPLRAIAGFSHALEEELPAGGNAEAQRLFERIRAATRRMGQRIDGLLNLAQVSRRQLDTRTVDLGRIAEEIVAELRQRDPERRVEVVVEPDLVATGDPQLLRALVENLLENAWKFTLSATTARIEVGAETGSRDTVFHVRDNGAGFDMAFADKLFAAFSRLHAYDEYPGTGIGLATVQRIVQRHGGRIWAEAAPGAGATFFFTLGETEWATN